MPKPSKTRLYQHFYNGISNQSGIWVLWGAQVPHRVVWDVRWSISVDWLKGELSKGVFSCEKKLRRKKEYEKREIE
jgi:hypothetical protein